jgi:SagB-type dehydrogenase family enzyme
MVAEPQHTPVPATHVIIRRRPGPLPRRIDLETLTYVALAEGVRRVDEGPDQVAYESAPNAFRPRLTLRQVTPGISAALRRLEGEGTTGGLLAGMVVGSDGPMGVGKLFHYLGRLDGLAILSRRLVVDGGTLAHLEPISPYLRWNEGAVDAAASYALSRFAVVRNDRGRLLVESPRGHARVFLTARGSGALAGLLQPRTPAQLGEAMGLGEEAALTLLRFLVNAGLAVPAEAGDLAPEDKDLVLAQWEFHDMLLHTRSRLGRHSDPYGGTFPFKGKIDPLPVVKPVKGEPIPLRTPDLAALGTQDVPFSQVLEKRASLRAHDPANPITVEQLGEFLYRAARVKRQSAKSGVSFRPAASAGALHSLEVYPVVGECRGLASGLYHYDPQGHALHLVSEPNDAVRMLLHLGGVTAMMPAPPQVLLCIASRFQRVQNKYRSVSYSVILKDVGALYQTFYLVATAMGLAPCGLGGGHSDLFAQAAGTDYFTETTVGEFTLGTVGPGAWDAAGGEQWHTQHPAPPGSGGA